MHIPKSLQVVSKTAEESARETLPPDQGKTPIHEDRKTKAPEFDRQKVQEAQEEREAQPSPRPLITEQICLPASIPEPLDTDSFLDLL